MIRGILFTVGMMFVLFGTSTASHADAKVCWIKNENNGTWRMARNLLNKPKHCFVHAECGADGLCELESEPPGPVAR